MTRIATRLRPFGESIFTPFSRLALQHGAVNLGQGFPNFDGPDAVKDAAVAAIRAGHNQYAPSPGVPDLRRAIAAWYAPAGLAFDPDAEVTTTSGCTEAIAATMLGLLEPGDEVILFEPWYDAYPAAVAMAGGTVRGVPLRDPDFSFDPDELRRAVGPRTRAILVNTPHNPSGKVFSAAELELVRAACLEHDLLAIVDEVYERLVFAGEHRHLASLPGMRERTVTLSSLGKTFSFTGWKIGWAAAPADLTAGVRAAHQFLTFASATPFQHAGAAALALPRAYYDEFVADYRRRRDLLVAGLAEIGFVVAPPEGTYFVLADHRPFGFPDDMAFCRHLVEHVGVAAIPPSVFYSDPQRGAHLVRFAFCKTDELLHEALERMRRGLRRR